MASPSCCEILSQYAKASWADMGYSNDEVPVPTADDLRRWMPPFDITLALPFLGELYRIVPFIWHLECQINLTLWQ